MAASLLLTPTQASACHNGKVRSLNGWPKPPWTHLHVSNIGATGDMVCSPASDSEFAFQPHARAMSLLSSGISEISKIT